ncbi:MAG: C25 family cysteine peptidase, partial [Bacteroidales bacterium]
MSKIDSANYIITFDGANYTDRHSLPYWSETFFDNALSEKVNISNCKFSALSQSEKLLIDALKINIPAIITPLSTKVTNRKQTGIHVEIIPFIRDSATNQVLKLASFSIQFTENDKPEAVISKTYASSSVLSKGNWYKLAVTQTGMHRLGYSDLAGMGINPSTINPAHIGIFGRGGTMLPEPNEQFRADDLPENAIEVTGQADGTFDQGDYIVFYAQGPTSWQYNNLKQMWEHIPHLYADTISYFLSPDQGTGKRIPSKASSAETATDNVDAYDFYTTFDENDFNLLKSGRQWFSQVFDVITNRSYPFDIPALASDGEVKVRSVSAAKSINASSFEFTIGTQTWTVPHTAISTYDNSPVATGAVAYKTLLSVTLPLKIDTRYIRTSSSSAGYLDLLDINARCTLKFTNGQLHFRDSRSFGTGNTALYRVNGAAGKAKIWDVTNPVSAYAVNAETDGNDLVFKIMADTLRQLVAFDGTDFLTPRFIHKIQNQDLHASKGADMVIVAPQQFMAQAVRLANFHSAATDLDVLVLDPTTIYNEFSSGTVDITAIRDFMKMLYDRASTDKMPKYLLL